MDQGTCSEDEEEVSVLEKRRREVWGGNLDEEGMLVHSVVEDTEGCSSFASKNKTRGGSAMLLWGIVLPLSKGPGDSAALR